MSKLTYIFKDGSQQHEKAVWESLSAATVQAKEQLKWHKNLHMVRINPLDGSAPLNIIREEK